MKKTLTIATGLLIALVWSAMAMAVGTANSWYVELTFSTPNSTDKFPVRLGEGAQADSLMKPPAVPGKKYNETFAPVIRASVLTDDSLKAVWRIDTKDTQAPAKIWAINVETEETGVLVSMQVDLAEFPTNLSYKLLAIDPVTGEGTPFVTTGQTKPIFTTDASGAKVVYILAGTSQTFVSSSGTSVSGMVRFYKNPAVSAAGAKLFNFANCQTVDYSGCSVLATAGTNGIFNIPSLAAGNYTFRVDAPNAIGTLIKDVDVSAEGNNAKAGSDLYLGDVKEDGAISLNDLAPIKKCFGSIAGDENYEVRCDVNKDGRVDLSDVAKLKPGFGKYECWIDSSCN